MEAREYETKNFVLESKNYLISNDALKLSYSEEGWLLAEELNRLKLKKEQEDYYRELFEETSNGRRTLSFRLTQYLCKN